MPLTSKRDRAARESGPKTTGAKDSPWGGLKSRFLDSLDPAEQLRIFDLSARTAQNLHRWAARYPLIRRVRVWPLSLSVTAGAITTVQAQSRGRAVLGRPLPVVQQVGFHDTEIVIGDVRELRAAFDIPKRPDAAHRRFQTLIGLNMSLRVYCDAGRL